MPTPLERALESVYAASQVGVVLFGVLFLVYGIGGAIAVFGGFIEYPYQFFSVETDPFFNLFTTFLSFFLVTQSIALILLIDITGHRGENSDVVIILSMIALGFGAAAFAATYSTTLEFLRGVISLVVSAGWKSSIVLRTLVRTGSNISVGGEQWDMAIVNSIVGITALLVGLVLFVLVVALVVDIARWVRNPEANSGLQE